MWTHESRKEGRSQLDLDGFHCPGGGGGGRGGRLFKDGRVEAALGKYNRALKLVQVHRDIKGYTSAGYTTLNNLFSQGSTSKCDRALKLAQEVEEVVLVVGGGFPLRPAPTAHCRPAARMA
jgi:hypothetical protein